MDRIRAAISRARVAKKTDNGATATALAARPPAPLRQTDHGDQSQERFQRFSCDFQNFRAHRIIANEQDPALNAFRVLRTRVAQLMEANDWRTLAVVSPTASTGKTVTAINLSIALGDKAGVRPVLVDFDFYRPSVAKYLGVKDVPSVIDYFEGARSVEAVTIRPDLTDMLVIPNERVTRKGAEYLTSERVDHLISAAMDDYGSQAVIFDTSPLLGCDDTIAFLPKVDCVLLVAASGETLVKDLKEAKRILSKTNIIGTVLNKAPRAITTNQYY